MASSNPTAAAGRRRRPKRTPAQQGSPNGDGSQYHMKAISRTLDVLECFTDQRPELSLTEISQTIGLPESSLFRILLTLESRQYLLQNADGTYALAPRLLHGKIQERADRVRKLVHPYLQDLASRFDETASSAYLFEDRVHALDTVETFHAIRMTNRPGRVLPPHASSLGKAIAAFQSFTVVERMLEVYGLVRRTDKTVLDRQVLREEFDRIRAQGYAIDREESVVGGICIGAAITIDNRPVVAALSISTPVVRMTGSREIEITRAVLDSARQAAVALAQA